ncbi:unnamed protein product [marine sediment metagenome]|uniref:Uncharacterized protein n=1 Tax=marine sediment metagenome TaxID=412755 RepID=X1DVC8_9ZZZZ
MWATDELDPNLDTVFTTYTESDVPPPPPPDTPVITITSTYNVVAQAMGILTLIGAVISGTKYFSLVV